MTANFTYDAKTTIRNFLTSSNPNLQETLAVMGAAQENAPVEIKILSASQICSPIQDAQQKAMEPTKAFFKDLNIEITSESPETGEITILATKQNLKLMLEKTLANNPTKLAAVKKLSGNLSITLDKENFKPKAPTVASR